MEPGPQQPPPEPGRRRFVPLPDLWAADNWDSDQVNERIADDFEQP